VTVSGQRTVLFVCPHGAGKSRIAAAWFCGLGVAGWTATSAGVQPQARVSVHAARLLAGTPVSALLDEALPRPMSAVSQPDLVVAIDCPPEVDADVRWDLAHQEFDEGMCAELRDRVEHLVTSRRVDGPVGMLGSNHGSG
jgi:protein-tyrosine-phosphatase